MILPARTCSACGITMTYIWETIAGRIVCLGCSTRSAVVIPILTAAGGCLVPCRCTAQAEALNQTALNADLIGDGVWEEES